MKFNAVQINSAPEILVQEIISQIESGKLEPGACLPSQRELAKMFNVGLGSVREAIKILDVMEYVDVIRGKGTYISKNAIKQKSYSSFEKAWKAISMSDIITARNVVECFAAREAAKNALPDNINFLKTISRKMDASHNDKDTYYDLDFQFHIAVAEASANKAILQIVKLLIKQSIQHTLFMSNSLNIALSFNVEKAIESARAVISCIDAGDEHGAEKHMEEHINIVVIELDKEFLTKK